MHTVALASLLTLSARLGAKSDGSVAESPG